MAISSIGLANAANPHSATHPIKTVGKCNLVYWTSDDSTVYDVTNDKRNNFILPLDGNPTTWYYLNIKSIKPDISVNPQYSYELFPFYLDQESVATNTAFWEYWDARLAVPLANNEQWAVVMDDILNSVWPMFLLKATPTGELMFVDYLQYFVDNSDGNMDYNNYVLSPLRINGDYPQGTYSFVGHSDEVGDYAVGIYPNNDFDIVEPNPLTDISMTITFRQ